MYTLKFLTVALLAFLAVVYLIIVSSIYINQTGMIFQSAALAKDHRFNYQDEFEEINTESFDGVNLHGLLFKAQHSKGLIFYLHGNAGTLDTWGDISKIYTSLGYDIFILDYRSFGKSEGKIESEEQLNKDVAAVYKVLKSRYAEKNIIITGYSIGSGLAAILASENHPKALLLQSPYYSFTALSSQRVPFFPDFMKKFRFDTFKYLPKVAAPIHIFHGTDDQLISFENSVKLKELLQDKADLYPLHNQGHVGVNENTDFQNALKIILQ
jgi:pimeloyl-ACP methyl ester carboxylesterase